MHLAHPKYRPDIDGLRAVAILAVVCFHIFPSNMPGGFIGVDIFFVISGYLISTIIFSSLERERFSLVEFYVRRIRRIFPALIIVLVSCLIFGWYILFADEFRQLGKHTVAGAAFIQNLILWRESGYFDSSAESKPLLHLWSLAIEEQFYIFWPLLLAYVWKKNWSFLKITASIAAVSFAVSIYMITTGYSAAAFYHPYSRFWELMAGGILAYAVLHRPDLLEKHKEVQSVTGFALVVSGLMLVNRNSDFPGWWALLPVAGAFLIISAGANSWLNARLLGNPVMVWLGLISYPLYLWHWPVLVYLKIAFVEISDSARIAAVAASLLLATLTYHFVEKPVRYRMAQRTSVSMLMTLLALTSTSGWAIYAFNFLDNPKMLEIGKDFQYHRTHHASCNDKSLAGAELGYCYSSGEGVTKAVLIGDSHADDKFYGFANYDAKRNWMMMGHQACPPVLGIGVESTIKDCRKKFDLIFDWIERHPQVDTVVLAYFGNYFSETAYAADHKKTQPGQNVIRITSDDNLSAYDTFTLGMKNSIERLTRLNKRVVILTDIPELPYFPRDCERQGTLCTVPIDEVYARQSGHRRMIADLQRSFPSVIVFDPISILCDSRLCSYKKGDTIMYRDSHHLTLSGSQLYGKLFIDWLNNLQQ